MTNPVRSLLFALGLLGLALGPTAFATSGFTVAGVDLDDIFEPIGSTAPRADVGWNVNGVDLAQRYRQSVWGATDQIASDTGYQSGTTDLRYLFRKKGYVSPGGPVKTTFYYAGGLQGYTVPANAQSVVVKVWGAGGGGGFLSSGGYGGYAQMTITPPAGSTLSVLVGQAGGYQSGPTYGGGADLPLNYFGHGAGGGRSEIYVAGIRLVAGGGGGGGDNNGSGGTSTGGQGGGASLNGGQGGSTYYGEGGGGGTQSAGGFSGINWGINYRAPEGVGSADNGGAWPWAVGQAPGGGGGGYYGGGGGGGNGAGAGGGSGYAAGGTGVVGYSHNNSGDPDYVSPAGNPNNHGLVVIIAYVADYP